LYRDNLDFHTGPANGIGQIARVFPKCDFFGGVGRYGHGSLLSHPSVIKGRLFHFVCPVADRNQPAGSITTPVCARSKSDLTSAPLAQRIDASNTRRPLRRPLKSDVPGRPKNKGRPQLADGTCCLEMNLIRASGSSPQSPNRERAAPVCFQQLGPFSHFGVRLTGVAQTFLLIGD